MQQRKFLHFMYKKIVSDKNFGGRTCGTPKFRRILAYQKNEQN